MGLFSGMLKIMLEHRAGPCDVLESIVSSGRNEIADSQDSSEKQIDNTYTKSYAGTKTCTSCGGTGEDSDRYEPLFNVYAPCGTCHGEGVI